MPWARRRQAYRFLLTALSRSGDTRSFSSARHRPQRDKPPTVGWVRQAGPAQGRVVIEDRARNPAEEGEGANMAVQKRLGRLPRIRLHEPDVGMRQDQTEEGDLLAPAPDLDDRLAEVDLGMARRMVQRNEGLARRLPLRPDVVLDDPDRVKTRAVARKQLWVTVVCDVLRRFHIIWRFGAGSPAEGAPALRGSMCGARFWPDSRLTPSRRRPRREHRPGRSHGGCCTPAP